MYAAIHIQSDIVFILNQLSQYLSDSVKHHEHALKKLLQYLRSIIDLDIVYCTSESQTIIEYSNSDYTSNKQN